MPVQLQDAIEFGWAALLEEVGEPFVPDWRAYGFCAGEVRGGNWPGHPHWWSISFWDMNVWPRPFCGIAHAFVDRQTGDTRVCVYDSYDPAFNWDE